MVEYLDPGLDRVFQALADSTRRGLLARLSHGQATVGELAEPYDLSLAAISKHIKVLERADLVCQVKRGRQRLCRVRPEGLREASRVIAYYEKFWNRRLDGLQAHLLQEKAKARK